MPDTEPDRGAFLSILQALDRPGQAVRNVLRGNYGAAGRQLGQLGADVVDSVLPGDWLPNDIAKPEDFVSGSELAGIDDSYGPIKTLADMGIGALTDPLSYIPGSLVAKGLGKAGALAAKGVSAVDKLVPGTEAAVQSAGRTARSVFGQQRVMPELRAVIDPARTTGQQEAAAGLGAAGEALHGLDERQLNIVGDALDNFKWGEDGKLAGPLVDSEPDISTGLKSGTLADRIAAHPDVQPDEVARLTEAANGAATIGQNEKNFPGIFDRPGDLSNEYLGRIYEGLPEQDVLGEAQGVSRPNATKERSQVTWRDVKSFLEKPGNEGVTYQRNALLRMAKRGEQQGTLATRASIGQGIIDLARQGKLQLPEDMLVDEAARLRSGAPKPPIPESGAYADVNKMLGGEGADPALVDPYGTELAAGKGKLSEQADVSSMLGGARVAPEMPEGINAANEAVQAEQTGKSVVGASTKQPSLTAADFKPEEMEAASKSLLGKDFAYTDPQSRALVTGTLKALATHDPESAKFALDAVNGIAPRGAFTRLLAGNNSYFKKAATYGLVIPKFGSIVRNRLNAVWQTLSNPEARSTTLQGASRIVSDFSGAVSDSLGLSIGKDKFSGIISDWEKALAGSEGSSANALAKLAETQPDAAAFIKAGGLDGYVRGEDLIKAMQSTPWQKKFGNILDWPGRLFKGVEDRMRLGMGADLMAQGKTAEEAARITGDALYRYGSTSAANRAARDFIPYFQWTAGAVPAEAKFLMEKPYVATAIAGGMTQDPKKAPLYPYLDDRLNFDLGTDEKGNRNVIGGFGFPFETLASIPNPSASIGDFGRQLEQGVFGQSGPLLKSAYGLVTGHDPNFETPYGSYDKIPLVGHAGEAGRLYNDIAGTGLIQPIVTPAQIADKWLDERRSLPLRALDSLTGANVVTVDPDKARMQQLTDALARNPDVMQSERPVNINHDPDVQELIDALGKANANIRAKKKQAKAGLP